MNPGRQKFRLQKNLLMSGTFRYICVYSGKVNSWVMSVELRHPSLEIGRFLGKYYKLRLRTYFYNVLCLEDKGHGLQATLFLDD